MNNSNIQNPIYLDYAATTPLDNRVLHEMLPYLQETELFGNSASITHIYGWRAKKACEDARKLIANCFSITPQEVIFTSGATESNNLALLGAAFGNQHFGKHIITCATEHKAVLDTCKFLETQGFAVTYLLPEKNGIIASEKLQEALRLDTILVSIMHVNNETGVIQDVAALGEIITSYNLTTNKNIIFHVDAAQSVGKIPIDLSKLKIDLMSVSGHKIYAPKGIGMLYVNRTKNLNLQPQIHGGGHEFGYRSGTLATAQIVGLACALKLSVESLESESKKLQQLETVFINKILNLKGVTLNGDLQRRKPGHLNISVAGMEGESLLASLYKLAISSGSACNSAVASTSHVLAAMQVPEVLRHNALRITMGRYTTENDVNIACEHLITTIAKLRAISPVLVEN